MGRVFIGTSGWQYKHWQGVFYPSGLPLKRWFSFYSQYFNSVEVNSSFYRQPTKETIVKWLEETPKDFAFSLKATRFITHIKRLNVDKKTMKNFYNCISSFENSPHVVLWQLPPNMRKDFKKISAFLRFLPKTSRNAFEFRHESWDDKEVFSLLQKFNAAVVFQDWHKWPKINKITADFVYMRFHGREKLYFSSYTKKELEKSAVYIKKLIHSGVDIYVFFNNDAFGNAVSNALYLQKLLPL